MNDHKLELPRILIIAATGTLAILSLYLFVGIVNGVDDFGRGEPSTNVITVTGVGTAAAAPDIAQVSFTVQQTDSTVAAAQDAATKQTNDAIDAMKALGIDDKDVRTASYQVYPQYAPAVCSPGMMCTSGSKVTGYQVSASIDVKVRDIDKAADVLEKLGSLNVQNISGPNFSVDDDSSVQDEARGEAIADAQQKAALLAKQLGVRLGKVVSFNEQRGGYPYPVAYGGTMMKSEAAVDSVAPSLPMGENETNVTVSITYEIR
jgi:uncharacterized protein YggE